MKLEDYIDKKLALGEVGVEPDAFVTLLGVESFGIWIDRSTSEQNEVVRFVPFSQIRFLCPLK
jgi:hypothetical protein